MKTIKLKSGDEMPMLGLGTWQLTGQDCKQAVPQALEMGYNHIDTAAAYGNHRDIAAGLKDAGVERDELFITSKVWRDDLKYGDVIEAGEKILAELEIDYLNLLLIHWPNSKIAISETLRGLSDLKQQGKTRNVGVSNFTINHLEEAMKIDPELITVNQVEFHPYLNQSELLHYCQENDIVLTAYSPLARGRIFEDDVLQQLAEENDKSVSQLVLRWLIEKDIVVIPKASSRDHLQDNLEVFGWELPDDAKEKIEELNDNDRIIDPPFGEFNY